MMVKDYDNAQQLLETVYTVSPGTEVGNMLAKVYTEVGLYDKAYNLYKVISVAAPGSITVMLAMADCKCRQKDYAMALNHLKPVLEFFPEHEEAQRLLAIIKKGEYNMSIDSIEKETEIKKIKRKNFLAEMTAFIWKQKAYWLLPVVLFLVLLIFLIAVGTSPVSPFIYTII